MRRSSLALAVPLLVVACSSSRLSQNFAVQCGPPPTHAAGDVFVEVSDSAAHSGGALDLEPLPDVRVTGTALTVTLVTPAGRVHCSAGSGSARVQATGDLAGVRLLIGAGGARTVHVHDQHDAELGAASFTGTPTTISWSGR